MTKFCLWIGTALASAPALAEPVRLGGASRVRYEAIDGQARAGFSASDELLNVRTTLSAEYETGPVRLVAELWDSRAYGADRRTPISTNEVNALELVQLYAEARLASGPGLTATGQAGRFLLNLGSRRLVAADDYRNTTNGYTGLRADLSAPGGWRATAIYMLPQVRRPDDLDALLDNKVRIDRESFDQVLWGGLISRAKTIAGATAELSFFHLGERDRPGRPTRDRSLNTASARVIREPRAGKIDFEVETIIQRGQAAASAAAGAARLPVRAGFVHADLGYTFDGPWQPRLSFDYDHASGDRSGGRFGRFDTLFGMRRADLAPAGLYNAIARTNILSPGVRLEVVPDKRTDGFVSYRPIWLAARADSFASTGVRDATGRSGRFAGHQIDMRVRHSLTKALRLELDGVLLAKGRFLLDAPNAPAGDWTRYMSVNATLSF